jgi:hypothetical protein
MGNPQPKFFGSFINDLRIMKNVSLNMQWDFVVGHSIYNNVRHALYRDRIAKDFDRAIEMNGESGAFVSVYNGLFNGALPISWFVENGTYARMRNLSLTYDFADFKRAQFMTKLSISVALRNFLTITNYTGIDPESTSTGVVPPEQTLWGNSGPVRGLDDIGFPNVKSFQIGISVEL